MLLYIGSRNAQVAHPNLNALNKRDVNNVLPVFSKLDNEIQPFSIRDCLRLGKQLHLNHSHKIVKLSLGNIVCMSNEHTAP